MNWDWDKLQEQRQKHSGGGGGGGPVPPDFGEFADKFRRFKKFNLPAGKLVFAALVLLWLASGIYTVQPAQVGVVKRFGAYNRTTLPGLNYHMPYPFESVMTPDVEKIRRYEVGFRSLNRDRRRTFEQGATKDVPQESLMLTGDENIVDVQFIVQYVIKDAKDYLFNITDPEGTVEHAAEAAMREVIGKSKIDMALTEGKSEIQLECRELMQSILDSYQSGLYVRSVQLQRVQAPTEVIDAFKDVASAREDKSRYINEAEAYSNDILPKARGQAAVVVNQAEAYRESKIRRATGESKRFLSVLTEYNKAKDVTRTRLYLETMEKVLSNPDLQKVILSDEALKKSIPYLPLGGGLGSGAATAPKKQ